jgi:MFS transporter, FHS family, glucose/mannose:H+ symporter
LRSGLGASRKALFLLACMEMAVFGVVMTTLGAVLPAVVDRFGISKADAGALFTLVNLGVLIGSLLFGPIADRYGYKGMLAGATALIAVALEGIAFAPSMAVLRASVIVVGAAGGLVNGGANALAADLSAGGRSGGLALVGSCFGIGAVGVPLALSARNGALIYAPVIAWAGAIVLLVVVYAATLRFPPPKQARGFPLAHAGRLLGDPVLLLMGIVLFLESGVEGVIGGWTTTYAGEELGLGGRLALVLLALFWLGLTLMRVALGTAFRRVPPARALFTCLTLAVVSVIVLLAAHGAIVATAATFLLGCGLAGSFPIVLSFAGDRYAELSGTAFSVVMSMALAGGMLLPYAAGVMGAAVGLRGAFALVPASLVLLMALVAVVGGRIAAPPLSASVVTR